MIRILNGYADSIPLLTQKDQDLMVALDIGVSKPLVSYTQQVGMGGYCSTIVYIHKKKGK